MPNQVSVLYKDAKIEREVSYYRMEKVPTYFTGVSCNNWWRLIFIYDYISQHILIKLNFKHGLLNYPLFTF